MDGTASQTTSQTALGPGPSPNEPAAAPALRLPPDAMGALADEYFRELDLRPWHRFSSIPWDAIEIDRLSEDQRSALQFITFIEDHLPGYFLEYQRLFPVHADTELDDYEHNRELYRFTVKWAQEEDAHAHVLYTYQVRAGLSEPAALRRRLAEEGRKPFHLEVTDPVGVFAYTLIQEKATQMFYQQFERAIDEPVLKDILRHLIRDEARHFAFFSRVLKAYIDRFGDRALPAVQEVVERFKMPLSATLRGYWRWSLRIADAVGGYDHTEAYEHLLRVLRNCGEAATTSKAHDLMELVSAIRARA